MKFAYSLIVPILAMLMFGCANESNIAQSDPPTISPVNADPVAFVDNAKRPEIPDLAAVPRYVEIYGKAPRYIQDWKMQCLYAMSFNAKFRIRANDPTFIQEQMNKAGFKGSRDEYVRKQLDIAEKTEKFMAIVLREIVKK